MVNPFMADTLVCGGRFRSVKDIHQLLVNIEETELLRNITLLLVAVNESRTNGFIYISVKQIPIAKCLMFFHHSGLPVLVRFAEA